MSDETCPECGQPVCKKCGSCKNDECGQNGCMHG